MTARGRTLLLLTACASLVACGGRNHLAAPNTFTSDWRQVATDDDRGRLRRWRQAWTDALARASAAHGAALRSPLFDPDRTLADALPPPGRYLCRIHKIGANGSGSRDFTAYPPAECRIASDGGVMTFYRTGGAQRPVGRLYRDGPTRVVFLGSLVLGDETKPLAYGQDARRDLAGYVERIGDDRWRLVLPYPRFESLLDVIELTPER